MKLSSRRSQCWQPSSSSGAAAAARPSAPRFRPASPVPTDASLGTPVLGFGAAGRVERTPVIFLHGNNDTPFPTACNPYGHVHVDGAVLRSTTAIARASSGASATRATSAICVDRPDQPVGRRALDGRERSRSARVRARGARVHRREARRHRRPQPRRDARPRVAAAGPRVPPRPASRRDRRRRTTASSTARPRR